MNAENSAPKRFYRSRSDRVIGGVCGGLAQYLEMDPAVVRILMLIAIMAFGFGAILYIAALIIVPEEPVSAAAPAAGAAAPARPRVDHHTVSLIFGAMMVLFGALLLLDQFHVFGRGWFHFQFFPWRLFWPVLFIGLGIYLVASGGTVQEKAKGVKNWAHVNRLHKSRTDRMFAGVIGGLAESWRIDPGILRVLFVVSSIFSGGIVVFAYIIAALVLPYADEMPADAENNGVK